MSCGVNYYRVLNSDKSVYKGKDVYFDKNFDLKIDTSIMKKLWLLIEASNDSAV